MYFRSFAIYAVAFSASEVSIDQAWSAQGNETQILNGVVVDQVQAECAAAGACVDGDNAVIACVVDT